MKHFTFFLIAVATMAGLAALIAPAPGRADEEPAPAFVTEIPQGYRDWKWISFGKGLQPHKAVKLYVFGLVDDTRSPTTELLDDAIVQDGLADHSRPILSAPDKLVNGGGISAALEDRWRDIAMGPIHWE